MRRGYGGRVIKNVVVVDFQKREVVEDYSKMLDQSPEVLDVMASEFLKEDTLDSQLGIHEVYEDDLSQEWQGAERWERFMLLED